MPLSKDNQAERLARIDALMEEYRLKHEDLEAYLRTRLEQSRQFNEDAKLRLVQARQRPRKKR